MTEHLLVGLTLIITLGIGAQWLAWRFRVPSILLLLVLGFGAGNTTDLVDPDAMFGDVLFPAVSLAVAIILFEGGLSLKYSEVREVGANVLVLVSIGAAVTWAIGSLAAWAILGLPGGLSILLGAILVVTGPTVITPLLRHVRPVGAVGAILKWEGIVIDPIGAMLTVLVFETLVAGHVSLAGTVGGIARTIGVSTLIGTLAAASLAMLLRRFWIPDFLQNPVALMFLLAAFTTSNVFQEESGLFTAPLMGMVLANWRGISVRHIVEFQENVRVLLLAALFIVLGARVQLSELQDLGWRSVLYLAVLILIARPAAVFISTLRSALSSRERAFLAVMAPRGVVAAAVASIFAIRLVESGRPLGERLVAETFLVIVGTVAVYGLAASPLANALGVAKRHRKGVLIVGAYAWARQIALALHNEGQPVLLVDTNRTNVNNARMAGLPVAHTDALSAEALEKIDVGGIGRLLALTSNDEFNSLAAIHFADVFGRSDVYQLPPERRNEKGAESHLHGRLLFGEAVTFTNLTVRFAHGARVRATPLTRYFDHDDYMRTYGRSATPLFIVTAEGELVVYTTENQPTPTPGQTLISIVQPEYAERTDASRRRRTLFRRERSPASG